MKRLEIINELMVENQILEQQISELDQQIDTLQNTRSSLEQVLKNISATIEIGIQESRTSLNALANKTKSISEQMDNLSRQQNIESDEMAISSHEIENLKGLTLLLHEPMRTGRGPLMIKSQRHQSAMNNLGNSLSNMQTELSEQLTVRKENQAHIKQSGKEIADALSLQREETKLSKRSFNNVLTLHNMRGKIYDAFLQNSSDLSNCCIDRIQHSDTIAINQSEIRNLRLQIADEEALEPTTPTP